MCVDVTQTLPSLAQYSPGDTAARLGSLNTHTHTSDLHTLLNLWYTCTYLTTGGKSNEILYLSKSSYSQIYLLEVLILIFNTHSFFSGTYNYL